MNPSLSWINALLGLWLILAPFVLAYTGQVEASAVEGAIGGAQTALWNDIVVGAIVPVLGVWSALSSRRRAVRPISAPQRPGRGARRRTRRTHLAAGPVEVGPAGALRASARDNLPGPWIE